jgi:hypothetical protein
MQQLLTSENASVTIDTSVDALELSCSLKQAHITCRPTPQNMPSRAETMGLVQPPNSFLLPSHYEVVRRVWNWKQDGRFILIFFDIWQAEIAGHYAFCVYEAGTLKPLIRPRHPVQAAVLRLLLETELVPHNASTPFIVKTGMQVDRAINIGGQ